MITFCNLFLCYNVLGDTMNLEFKNAKDNPDLVAKSVYKEIINSNEDFNVCEINPLECNSYDFCRKYNVDPKIGIKCLIVEIIKKDGNELVALMVPIDYKYNMSLIRKMFKAREVSVAKEEVISKTNMECGSITGIGLPKEMHKFVDSIVFENEYIMMGSGLKKSKLYFRSKYLLKINNLEVLEDLKK